MTAAPRKAPVHLLWGEDPFLLREAALEILGDVRATEVDASEWRGGETSDLATPSLFGERRGLLVTDAKQLDDGAIAELRGYLAAPDPEAPLVLVAVVGERAKAPAALLKLVQGMGEVREVRVQRRDLPGWLQGRAKAKGLSLAPEGAAGLVERLGEAPAALEQALDQLATAFAGERITTELVARQFRGLGEQHVWDLCDKAFGRDLEGSMRSLRTLMSAREDPLLVLGGIASRLRDLVRVRSLPERLPPAELAKRAGLRFDWQARRYREQARRFTMDELVRLHERMVWADRALKSGASEDLVLPIVVAEIAGGSVGALV